jgi:hypothetical protein
MNTFVNLAAERVVGYLRNYDEPQPAEIIADILHYCEVQGIDFAEQCRIAEGYVQEEISLGEEFFG